MRNAGLEEAQAGIKIAGRNINNLRYADDTTLMAESEEELKSLMIKWKRRVKKVGWKLNIQKIKIMASGLITSWQIDGKQWKQWHTLFWGAPKSLQMLPATMKLKDTCSLEKTLENPLDCKGMQPVHPKGDQSWVFIGRTDVEAETPILWPPDAKSWLIWKDPDAGKDWRVEEKGTTEDEMVGWDHRLNGHEFEQALGVGDGQRSLVCCSPWGRK